MMKNLDKKKILYGLFYFLIFFRFLLPYFFIDGQEGLLGRIPTVYNTLVILSVMMMVALVSFGQFRWNRVDFLLIFIYVCLVFSTVINHGEIESTILHAAQVVLICFSVKCVLQDETGTQVFLHMVRDVCLAIFAADVVAAVIYPAGIPAITMSPEEPFLVYGNVNQTIRYMFPGLLCSVLLDAKQNRRISVATAFYFVGYVFLCFRVYFMATGLCGLLFLIAWSLGRPILAKNPRRFCGVILLAFFIFELVIVIFRSQIVTDFIVALFGKKPGFTGRDVLWANCLRFIPRKPVFGYGALSKERLFRMLYSPSGAHNYFLDVFFQRGFIGAVPVYIFLLVPLFRKAPKSREKEYYVLLGFALSYFLMFLFEPFYHLERYHITMFYVMHLLSEAFSRTPGGSGGELHPTEPARADEPGL